MTRKELEAEVSIQRRALYDIEKKLERYKQADTIRDSSVVISLNNTTISWQGGATQPNPALIKRVRELIAAAIEAGGE